MKIYISKNEFLYSDISIQLDFSLRPMRNMSTQQMLVQ